MSKLGDVEIAAADVNGNWLRVTAKAARDDDPRAIGRVYVENPRLRELYSGREDLFRGYRLAEGAAVLSSLSGETLWSVKLG